MMRTIIYAILGTLGGIAIAYAALVLWFSFWVGNHIQDGLDSVGDGINAHFEAQDAKYTAYEMDFFRKLVFHTFKEDAPDEIAKYLQNANIEFHQEDEYGSHYITAHGSHPDGYVLFKYEYPDSSLPDDHASFGYEHGESLTPLLQVGNFHGDLRYTLEALEIRARSGVQEHFFDLVQSVEQDANFLRTAALSKLRGQSYDDISQLIDAAGFDMIQKPDRIHVFIGAVRSVDFIFIDGTLSHITRNCAHTPETCHGQRN